MNTISSLLKFLGNTLGANPTTTLTTTSKTLVGALNEVAAKVAEDYIVAESQAEETVNGSGWWRWREWNSGKVEIWYRGTLTLDTTPSATGGVTRKSGHFSFPNSYALHKCTCHIDGTNNGAWYMCGGILDSNETDNDPRSIFEVMGYRVSGTPDASPRISIYICGEKNA